MKIIKYIYDHKKINIVITIFDMQWNLSKNIVLNLRKIKIKYFLLYN